MATQLALYPPPHTRAPHIFHTTHPTHFTIHSPHRAPHTALPSSTPSIPVGLWPVAWRVGEPVCLSLYFSPSHGTNIPWALLTKKILVLLLSVTN